MALPTDDAVPVPPVASEAEVKGDCPMGASEGPTHSLCWTHPLPPCYERHGDMNCRARLRNSLTSYQQSLLSTKRLSPEVRRLPRACHASCLAEPRGATCFKFRPKPHGEVIFHHNEKNSFFLTFGFSGPQPAWSGITVCWY